MESGWRSSYGDAWKKTVTLKELNDATVAWAEFEYNKGFHKEIESNPLERFLKNQDVSRPVPETELLKQAFRLRDRRRLRRSDGTISILGKRLRFQAGTVILKKFMLLT